MRHIFPKSSPPHLLTTFIFLLLFVSVTKTCSGEEEGAASFRHCKSTLFNCGSIRGVGYPFWGGNRSRDCGRIGFELFCRQTDKYSFLDITIHRFRVLGINHSNFTVRVARYFPWDNGCPPSASSFIEMTLDSTPFMYPDTVHPLSIFYDCTSDVTTQVQNGFTCPGSHMNRSAAFYADLSVPYAKECETRIKVPIFQSAYQELWGGNLTLEEALNQGFEIQYEKDNRICSTCEASGGVCGSKIASGPQGSYDDHFVCFCPDGSDPIACQGTKRKIWLAFTIGASALGAGLLVVGLIVCWKNKPNDDRSLEEFIKRHGSLAPKRYSYSDIKKMTNSLTDKLGQGGFGSVYKGKLPDGHLVAVKVLNVSKGNGEDFINEVASISRTSHVNVVTLKGYCLQGSKRALIYDFMPQGSLEKFICNETPSSTKVSLDRLEWDILYKITVGIARRLEYLHSGCNTRILHFDIKPHNILLDEDFCPKISDFGLSKLCTGKKTIVSMVGARGTVGYIAPEVFCRNFGGVSYKSDVYSYGMMILEMVGARKKMVDGEVDGSSSESYFPHWIYKRLEAGGDMELQAEMTTEEREITKKMTMVGLWCIQTDPSHRPSMGRVLEMLEGSIDRLEFPPQPFLSSPSRLLAEYSTTLTLSQIVTS